MRRNLGIIGATLATVAAVGITAAPASADPSREAPRIMLDPSADNTDIHAFTAPDAQGKVQG